MYVLKSQLEKKKLHYLFKIFYALKWISLGCDVSEVLPFSFVFQKFFSAHIGKGVSGKVVSLLELKSCQLAVLTTLHETVGVRRLS